MDNFREPQKNQILFPALDGIRAIAILSVVTYHTAYFNSTSPFQKVLFALTKSGWMGVPIFFVLSGFLISYTVFKAPQTFSIATYTIRRIAKIYPPFLLSIIVFAFLPHFWQTPEDLLARALANLTTFAHFYKDMGYLHQPYWSLLIEIHFYILFPLVYFVLRRTVRFPEWVTFFIFLTVPALVRFSSNQSESDDLATWFFHRNLFPRALDNFSLGILFSIICLNQNHRESIIRISTILAPLGFLLLTATYCSHGLCLRYLDRTTMSEVFRYCPAIATFLLLFSIFLPPLHVLSRLLNFKPLCFIGIISYEWYLFHYPPAQYLQHILGNASGNVSVYLCRTALPFIVTLLFSALVYFKFSEPILAWTKRQMRSRH